MTSPVSLFQATCKGQLEHVKDILRKASDAQADIHERKNVALLGAAMHGHERIADVLIKNGAEVDYCNSDKHTALHWAAYKGHATVVELLLAAGATVDKEDKDGNTALMFACSKGFEHTVRILLDFKASVHTRNHMNENALHIACLGGDNPVVVQFLVKFGSHLDEQGRHGWTPLHYCAQYDRIESIRVLTEAGANPTLLDNIQDTPLDIVEDKEIYNEQTYALLVEANRAWNVRSQELKERRRAKLQKEKDTPRRGRSEVEEDQQQEVDVEHEPNSDFTFMEDKPTI